MLKWQNQKVYTTEQLIKFFGLPANELNQIFRDNRADFIQNIDLFKLSGKSVKQFKNQLEKDDEMQHSTFIFLFTESGIKKLIALQETSNEPRN